MGVIRGFRPFARISVGTIYRLTFSRPMRGALIYRVLPGHQTLWGRVITILSASTFIGTAIALWSGGDGASASPVAASSPTSSVRTAIVAFSAIFFSEWGDVGQLVVVALVSRYGMPWLVCCAATAALATKGLLAVTLGATLREHLPRRTMRLGAAAMCAVLAVVSAIGLR